MKLNRKGFTLIELLAVIVVLGIILVIAIPKVVDTIENSRKGSFETSVKSYVKAAQQYVAKKEVEGQMVTSGNISDLDMQNKNGWEGTWISNNGIVTIININDTNSGYRAQNVTNNITGSYSCGDKCIYYNSADVTFYKLTTGSDGLTVSGTGSLSGPYTGNDKNIVIPEGVTTITEGTFKNVVNPNNITNIILPNTVSIIGESAFAYNSLTSFIIPNTVTTIKNSAFSNNQLISIVIPSSVVTIEGLAFVDNNSLQTIKSNGKPFSWRDIVFHSVGQCIDDATGTLTTGSFITGTCTSSGRTVTITE